MIEQVGILRIPFKGIEVDESTGSVAVYNLSKSVNMYIKHLNELLSNTCLIANSYAKVKKSNKKKKNDASFKISSSSFSILIFKDHVAIRYEFENEEQIEIQTKKEIVCEVLNKSLSCYNQTFKELTEMTEMENNSVYEVFGSENIKNYQKSLVSIDNIIDGEPFFAEIDGYPPILFEDCVQPPSLVKVFSEELLCYDNYLIDGLLKSNLELFLASGAGRGKGRGRKTISVTADQLKEIELIHNIILDNHIYDFKVVQSDFDKYKLVSFNKSLCAQEQLNLDKVQKVKQIEQ